MQYHINTGVLTITPSGGSAIVIGDLEDITVTVKRAKKARRGTSQFPVFLAYTEGECTVKIKVADIKADLYAAVCSTTATGTPKSMTMTNEVQGVADMFGISWTGTLDGKTFTFTLPTVSLPDLGIAVKAGDYTLTDIEGEAMAAAGGNILTITAAE
jgi:hypothetical protein